MIAVNRPSWKEMGTTALATAGVFALSVGILGAAKVWHEKNQELAGAQERLGHLQRWLKVKEEVTLRQQEALGPWVSSSSDIRDAQWVCLSGLQEAAQASGLSVQELRPSEIQAGSKKKKVLRLDVKVEGDLDRMGGFLRQLPDRIPGIRLEHLQMIPQSGGRGQCILRLNFKPLSDR